MHIFRTYFNGTAATVNKLNPFKKFTQKIWPVTCIKIIKRKNRSNKCIAISMLIQVCTVCYRVTYLPALDRDNQEKLQ